MPKLRDHYRAKHAHVVGARIARATCSRYDSASLCAGTHIIVVGSRRCTPASSSTEHLLAVRTRRHTVIGALRRCPATLVPDTCFSLTARA